MCCHCEFQNELSKHFFSINLWQFKLIVLSITSNNHKIVSCMLLWAREHEYAQHFLSHNVTRTKHWMPSTLSILWKKRNIVHYSSSMHTELHSFAVVQKLVSWNSDTNESRHKIHVTLSKRLQLYSDILKYVHPFKSRSGIFSSHEEVMPDLSFEILFALLLSSIHEKRKKNVLSEISPVLDGWTHFWDVLNTTRLFGKCGTHFLCPL